MRKTKRNWLLSLCGAVAALGLFTGIWACTPSVEATAAGSAPTVTMLAGASARKVAGETGIKFTAKIDNYNRDYKYGMLILPEAAWSGIGWNEDTNYLYSLIEEEGISTSSFANQICNPYTQDGEWYISFALKNIRNFNMSFVGVAYSCTDVNDFDTYTYTYVDQMNGFADNGRSMSYVAQMALKYDESLTSSQKSALKSYTSGNISIEEEDYLTDETVGVGGTANSQTVDYALQYNPNVNDYLAFISKNAYAEGTKISFDYYIPAGGEGGWWGIAWNNKKDNADHYHTAGLTDTEIKDGVVTNTGRPKNQGYKALNAKTTGVWNTVTVELTSDVADGDFYFYIGSDCGGNARGSSNWAFDDGKDAYILLDNFKVNGELVETFAEGDLSKSIIEVKDRGKATIAKVNKTEVSIGESGKVGEYAAKLDFTQQFEAESTNFMTKSTVAKGGDTISFKYYIPTDTTVGDWWCISWATDKANASYWVPDQVQTGNGGLSIGKNQGEWVDFSVTIPTDSEGYTYYLYFCCWGDNEEGKVHWNGCVYIDDFKVTRNGEVVVEENFNKGVKESIFNYNAAYVSDGEGFGAEVENPETPDVGGEEELAMKYIFNVSGETVSQVTKEAYAGGSTVSFKYYIPAGTPTSWWGLAYKTSNTGLSIYDAADASKAYAVTGSNTVTGSWTDVSFTLPSGGPYYLYFGSEVSSSNWKLDGENSYMLIDEFTINDEKETFNYGVENSIFAVLVAGAVSEGEGYVPMPQAAQILVDQLSATAGKFGLITNDAYAAGSTITFDYKITGNTNKKWWSVIWFTADNRSSLNIYAHTSGNGQAFEKDELDVWLTKTVTLPSSGGPYYITFGGALSEWNGGSLYIDNFTVTTSGTVVATEDFEEGYGIFYNNLPNRAVFIGEGKPGDSEPGEGGGEAVQIGEDVAAQINVDKFTGQALAEFITKDSYAAGSVVSFEYFIPSDVTFRVSSTWWTLCVTTDPLNADVYSNHYSTMTKVQGEWTKVSVTLDRAGYIYFAGAIGEWNDGCVYIDNFTVTLNGEVVASDDFNYGVGGGLFTVNNTNGAIVNYDGASELGANADPYAFENLLKDEANLSDVLENGGYASLISEVEVDATNLPEVTLLIEGSFDYTINGEKEFAIYFGNNYYIYINGASIAFYNGTTKVKEMAGSADATFYLAVTVGGKIAVRINDGGYVGLGSMNGAAEMMKIVALGGDGSVDFNNFAVGTYKCNWNLLHLDIPVYMTEEQIEFLAYGFDTNGNVSEKGFEELVEAGFTSVIGLYEGRVHALDGNKIDQLMTEVNNDAAVALALAEKYGVDYYMFNDAFNDNVYNKELHSYYDDMADKATYLLSSAFAGHVFVDEPTWNEAYDEGLFGIKSNYRFDSSKGQIVELVTAYQEYKKAFPDSQVYINLLPLEKYTTSTYTANNIECYKGYVNYYINYIAGTKANGGKTANGYEGTGYVSIDIYPLGLSDGTRSTMVEAHLWCLEFIANRCKEEGLDFRLIIKAAAENDTTNGKRGTDHINDLRLQLYSGLAYGVDEFGYFQYAATAASECGALTDSAQTYEMTKQVNRELHQFEAAYNSFTWQSASFYGTKPTGAKNISSAGAYGSLTNVSGGAILVGNFMDTDGKYTHGAEHAYVAVYYGDTDDQSTTDVKFTFNGKTRAMVYNEGELQVVTLSDGTMTLTMSKGEGAFIIPLN